MESPPPQFTKSTPSSRTKSVSRLAKTNCSIESLDLISSPPRKIPSTNSLPLHDLLLLSPSPARKSRTRLADRLELGDEAFLEPIGSRRRCKNKGAQLGSPRGNRRLKRRSEIEIREERDFVDEIGKVRRRRHSGRSKKDKLSLVATIPSSCCSQKVDDGDDGGNLDRLGVLTYDLIMWKDMAKSSLWFGFGCLCFLSSCFATGISFNVFSAISQLGLLILGASFFSNSICQRSNGIDKAKTFKLKEEDISRIGRLVLPAANLAISKTRELFSGEPSMTLKVTPFLLLGAEYGHLITLRRLWAFGFFLSFTLPKMFSCYSNQINEKVHLMVNWILETWSACSHKKIVAASAFTVFWNLSSVRTRIFTAFVSLVIVRCCRQNMLPGEAELVAEEVAAAAEEEDPQKALVVVAPETKTQ